MKLLGFTFDSRPNANKHAELLIGRFYNKLWTLRYLKKSGLEEDKLLEVYYSSIRSAIEYCSNVYHTQIQKSQSDKLESIQRHALRIIYGYQCNIDEVMTAKCIKKLEDRREESLLNFALKNEHTEKFGQRWFKPVLNSSTRNIRNSTREKYSVPYCRTERLRSNPVIQMTIMLNEHYKN